MITYVNKKLPKQTKHVPKPRHITSGSPTTRGCNESGKFVCCVNCNKECEGYV